MGTDLTREQEMALLGILEGQLGERQRQMNGLSLDEETVRHDHEAFVRLQRDIAADRADRADREAERPHRAPPRHERPGLLTGRAGGAAAAVCAVILVAFVLLVVG